MTTEANVFKRVFIKTNFLNLSALLIFSSLLLAGCQQQTAEPMRFYALGTIIEITLPGIEPQRRADMEARLIESFRHWQTHWHPWQVSDGNNLAIINQTLASDGSADADVEIIELINAARPYHEQSGGLFDPAIGDLVRVWGFNSDELPDTAPAETILADWLNERPRYSDLELRNGKLQSNNPKLQLDFSAFAKGYALEQAASLLKSAHIDNALINAGGDLVAIGRAEAGNSGRAWRIGIRHPRQPGILAELELGDGEALVTSGDYERFFMVAGERYHHILDPRTAHPGNGAISVSVLTENAGQADAAATALFVAGKKDWRSVAASMNINCAMLIDADGLIHMTDCMQQRLQLRVDSDKPVDTQRGRQSGIPQ